MSNSLAIAAVTTTLRNLITPAILNELGSGTVTAKPPDKAREPGDNGNQINIFLYQVLPNGSLRNMDLPNRVKPGETGQPPLALNLYYLMTAYGKDNDDILAHRLLGKAMQILHDFAVLNPADIKTALAESELHNQLERVRITLQPMSTEEVSKLWATFQTQYRISASYELSVVLIDSSRSVKTLLPALTRGSGDQGIFAQADMTPPFPTLEAVQPPNQQPSVRLGEVFSLKGHHLDSDDGRLVVLLMHPRFIAPRTLSLQQQRSDAEILYSRCATPTRW
jgi:Pvc16 N-terminal domain